MNKTKKNYLKAGLCFVIAMLFLLPIAGAKLYQYHIRHIQQNGHDYEVVWDDVIPDRAPDSADSRIAHDSEDNVIMVNSIKIDDCHSEAYIVKYDKDGNIEWTKQQDCEAICALPQVYDENFKGTINDIIEWTQVNLSDLRRALQLVGIEIPLTIVTDCVVADYIDVAVDSQDDIVAAGRFVWTLYLNDNGFFFYVSSFVTKYTPSGDIVWSNRYRRSIFDAATGITIDSNDNIYVCAGSKMLTTPESWTFRLLPDGTQVGCSIYDDREGGHNITTPYGIAFDPVCNHIWVAGDVANVNSAFTYFSNAFVLGYNPDGTTYNQWKYSVDTNRYEDVRSATVDKSGNVIVSGKRSTIDSNGDQTNIKAHIVKFSPIGALLWDSDSISFNSPSATNCFYDITVTGDNTIVAVSQMAVSQYQFRFYTVLFFNDGPFVIIDGETGVTATGQGVTVDSSSDIIVTGLLKPTFNDYYFYTIKYHIIDTNPISVVTQDSTMELEEITYAE